MSRASETRACSSSGGIEYDRDETAAGTIPGSSPGPWPGPAFYALRRAQALQGIELLETALDLLADNADRFSEIFDYGLLATAHLQRGDFQAARQAADEAAERISQTSPTVYALFVGYAGVAETYLALWEQALRTSERAALSGALARLARWACKKNQAYARVFHIGRPQAWRFRGLYHWLAGRPRRALNAWRKGLATAQQQAMPYEEGLSHYEIGRHLPADDPARQAHLARAGALFAQLQADYEQGRVEEALHGPSPPSDIR